MSRVGKMPIDIPQGVDVEINKENITVKGILGSLTLRTSSLVSIVNNAGKLQLSSLDESMASSAMCGTMRALIANMVHGVSKGFEKKLTLVGVGYKAQAVGPKLNLQIGFSHPVAKDMPTGISVFCPTQTEIIIKGFDLQVVGQIAAEVRALRPPEPYKGKGIRYSDEKVIIKETKKK